jgi:hypothetical protein
MVLLPTAFLGVGVVLFRVIHGRSFSWKDFNALDRYLPSGVGLSCTPSELYVENALVHFCRCDRRLGEWSSMLLARLSSGGGSVHCGAHVDARCRNKRGRGKNDADVPREAANRQSPADPGRVEEAGALAPADGAPRTRGRPDCPNRAGADEPSPASPAANVRITTADAPAVSASRNGRASTCTALALPGARGWRAPTKSTRAVVRTAPRYGSLTA